jgi:hypothetical protein
MESPQRPAHALAALIDWHSIASLAEAAVIELLRVASQCLESRSLRALCCRALHLRRALIEQHLEALPLESGDFWGIVIRLLVHLC